MTKTKAKMSRQGWYRDVEEAIKACDEALEKSIALTRRETYPYDCRMIVVDVQKVQKIKNILKNIIITSMPF